ncbi:MAG TPA: TfuA-like protein, partial [Chloroflexota bacterium]|nr:TfuA-like protein [Chloroflexota bacterium]
MSPGATRPRVCLFVGPSVSPADITAACAGLERHAVVDVLPPIQQGDVLRLLEELPEVIGIVDGYFFQVPAVLHKEIMLALQRGARVLGAASLGALRAAELDSFGMEGVGTIYRMFARGVIDGDDEVAVLHTDQTDGFRVLSEPLVNIRYNLRRAVARRIVTASTAAAVLASARQLHFTQRSYTAGLDSLASRDVPLHELARLRCFLESDAIDLKRADALTLVHTIQARLAGSRPWPPAPRHQVQRTIYLHLFEREYVGRSVNGRYVPESFALSLHKLLSPTLPSIIERVMWRCLAADEAHYRCSPAAQKASQSGAAAVEAQRPGSPGIDPERLLADFRGRRGLTCDATFETWLREHSFGTDELASCLLARARAASGLRLYRKEHPELRGLRTVYGRIAADVAGRLG